MSDIAVVLDNVKLGSSSGGTSESYMVEMAAANSTSRLFIIVIIIFQCFPNESVFAHQRAPFPLAMFGTNNNDRLDRGVKEKMLVASFFGVSRQPAQTQ